MGALHRCGQVLALTALVYPHYFRERTMQMGRYLGVFENGRLAAMIGERLGIIDTREMSAICTHPDFAGRGHARHLTAMLANDTRARQPAVPARELRERTREGAVRTHRLSPAPRHPVLVVTSHRGMSTCGASIHDHRDSPRRK